MPAPPSGDDYFVRVKLSVPINHVYTHLWAAKEAPIIVVQAHILDSSSFSNPKLSQNDLSDTSPNATKEEDHSTESGSANHWKPSTVSFRYTKPEPNPRRVLSLKSTTPPKKNSSRIAPFPNLADYVMPHLQGDESDKFSAGSSSSMSASSCSSSTSDDGRIRGGTGVKKALKKSRSRRKWSFGYATPSYLKATTCSEGKKTHFQASQANSESSFGSIDQTRRHSLTKNPKPGSFTLQSAKTSKKTSSLRMRILTNKSSFKSKSVNRATCSSALKDSKFPHKIELRDGETESDKIKVCPYNYCSLHGHHHSRAPQLKRLLSKRRRLIKTQKSMKLRNQSALRPECIDDIIRDIERSQTLLDKEDPELQDTANSSTASCSGGKEESDLSVQIDANLAEIGAQVHLNQERDFSMTEEPHETIERNASVGDSEHISVSPEAPKSQLHKSKHVSMWRLIHQHMVEKQSPSGSPDLLSSSSQNIGVEDHARESEEVEIQKMYAVKMVRKAVEKILLPEIQDRSSDNQSITSEITPEQSVSNVAVDTISGTEQEATALEEGKKAETKTPKSWSNLKKLILLKKFIKELEKVKKLKLPKSQNRSLEPVAEAEKVSLRRQMLDKKKSSEEWMLDYALQQVVGELAPTQKRKVAMLIKAFETVVPTSEEQLQVTFALPTIIGIRQEGCHSETEPQKCASEATSKVKVAGNAEQEEHGHGMSNFKLDLNNEISAPRGLTVEASHLSGVTYQPLHVTRSSIADAAGKLTVSESITCSASDSGPFKQLTMAREAKYRDTNSWQQEIPDCPNISAEFHKEDATESSREELGIESLPVEGSPSVSERSTSDDLAEANAGNIEISTAGSSGPPRELTASSEKNIRNSELKIESIEGLVLARDHEHDNSGYKGHITETDDEKHVSMWCLIHQHMVAGLAMEGKIIQPDKENEANVIDANTLDATESFDSRSGFAPSFQNAGVECFGADSEEVELHKIYAIKMVREAIEKVLLPEVQDQSSDDQSITSETTPDQEVMEKNSGERQELSISTSIDVAKNCSMVYEEGTNLANCNISEPNNEKTMSKAEKNAEKQLLKGWSNLKKMILLKRFIKELEKVRKLNPQRRQHLPPKSSPEAEEVFLRPQTMDERQRAEQWMLDYALQKVISELAPKQKRKVALLVKAFEILVPTSEGPESQATFAKFKDGNLECCCSESEAEKSASKATETETKVMNIVPSILAKNSEMAEEKEAQGKVHKDMASNCQVEVIKDGSDLSFVARSAALNGNSESKRNYQVASSADYDELEQQTVAKEKERDSETDLAAKIAYKTKLDKEKHMKMWHLLCQHVVSKVAAKVENQLLDGEDENDQVEGAKTLLQSRGDCDSRCQKVVFSQSDAVKLVQEAIQEILIPEIQGDTSDAQSIASDIIEQELFDKNQFDFGEPSISTSNDSSRDCSREGSKSEEKDNKLPTPDDKTAQQKPKNWNKLKKLILLKRAVKALEKARKSNPKAPRKLPQETEPAKEKVDLRSQQQDERKKAEEWMLDYSLQNIVTKLTPARKRRVSMLVEAFEAVIPLPEI
ncbi:Calcium/calmodulin-dependent protein kinase [Bertholletia excelsa]